MFFIHIDQFRLAMFQVQCTLDLINVDWVFLSRDKNSKV